MSKRLCAIALVLFVALSTAAAPVSGVIAAPQHAPVTAQSSAVPVTTSLLQFAQSEADAIAGSVDCRSGGSLFGWLLCPLVQGLFEAIEFVYSRMIVPFLVVDPLKADDGDPGNVTPEETLYRVWNNFRVIANILFIIVFIVALFGQAFSFVFTPYELKKILPRLAIGVIAVQLSWYIVGFTVDVFNIIGAGMRSLILTPIRGLNLDVSFDLGSVWDQIGQAIGIVGGGVLVGLATAGGLLSGLPLILFPIVFALITVFVVLLVRKLAIFLLVVTAPVAFVLWILPNTEGLFKRWWDIFIKALVLYPLIVALIAFGELFARVAINAEGTNDSRSLFTSIVAMFGFFGPYFFIPFVFRFVGGFIASLDGAANNIGRRMNERLLGDARYGYRHSRLQRMSNVKRARLSRVIDNRDKGGKFQRALRSPIVYTASRYGTLFGTPTERIGDQMEQYLKQMDDTVGAGRDATWYAILGDKHIISGENLDPDAIAAAKRLGVNSLRNDPIAVQAALQYGLRKAGSSQELEAVYKRFMDLDPNHKGVFAKGLSGKQRSRMFDRVANNSKDIQRFHLDLKYRDPENGFQIAGDTAKRARYIRELNEAKAGFSFNDYRESTWQGVEEIINGYRNGNRSDELTNELQTLRRSLNPMMTGGAPFSGHQKAMDVHRQLDQMFGYENGRRAA